jgi:hypothetical protein
MRTYKSEEYEYICDICGQSKIAMQETRFASAHRNFECAAKPRRLAVCTFRRVHEEVSGLLREEAGDRGDGA